MSRPNVTCFFLRSEKVLLMQKESTTVARSMFSLTKERKLVASI